jgi:mercuric ion transport protein
MSERARVIGVTGGALGLSGFAAALGLCCTVPWAVALLGVTGAVAFARLAFLMPYALLGAAALLAGGFWFAYRPPAACADGSCAVASRHGLRWIVWIATALVCALAAIALRFQVTSS